MSKITEIYAQYKAREKFKTVSELVEESLHIKNQQCKNWLKNTLDILNDFNTQLEENAI